MCITIVSISICMHARWWCCWCHMHHELHKEVREAWVAGQHRDNDYT